MFKLEQKKFVNHCKVFIIALLILGILLLSSCKQIQEEKALIVAEIIDWGLYEENKIGFGFRVINYGYKEADEVKVVCKIYSLSDEILLEVEKDISNIKETSVKIDKIYIQKPEEISNLENLRGICYASSCKDCELLEERLPELIEARK